LGELRYSRSRSSRPSRTSSATSGADNLSDKLKQRHADHSKWRKPDFDEGGWRRACDNVVHTLAGLRR
jgi:hypothetical protein